MLVKCTKSVLTRNQVTTSMQTCIDKQVPSRNSGYNTESPLALHVKLMSDGRRTVPVFKIKSGQG